MKDGGLLLVAKAFMFTAVYWLLRDMESGGTALLLYGSRASGNVRWLLSRSDALSVSRRGTVKNNFFVWIVFLCNRVGRHRQEGCHAVPLRISPVP